MHLDQEIPLLATPMQANMLMPALMGHECQPYIQQFRWTFNEAIDQKAFNKAWLNVFRRHDVFYHRFEISDEGQLIVRKSPRLQVDFSYETWCRCREKNRQSKLRTFLKEDLETGFDPGKDPLCRLKLIKMSARQFILVWTTHHALFDGRSRLTLMREFLEVYAAFKAGRRIRVVKASPYTDFLRWQTKRNWNGSKNFWKQQLQSVTESTPLSFGLDSEPQKQGGPKYKMANRFIESRLSRQMHQWSERSGLSLNVLLQAAWGFYLSKTSGNSTVLFAAPRVCRKSNIARGEETVGLFVNTVPVVVEIHPSDTIASFLKNIAQRWLAVRKHENTPISTIRECSAIPAGQPLFTSLAGYEKYQLGQLIDAPRGSRYSFNLTGFTELPFALQLKDGKRLKIEISYDRAQFAASTIQQTIDSLLVIFRQFTGPGCKALKSIGLLSKEQESCIRKLSTGKLSALPRKPVHKIFEEAATKWPTRTAIHFQGKALSYGEVNGRANQLARFLRRRGIKQGDKIGLYFNRGETILIAQLAVLKTGAVYVPIEIEYPKKRVQWMIKDIKPAIVLAEQNLSEKAEAVGLRACHLDSELKVLSKYSTSNLQAGVSWDAPAYIMYTSGSTGQPKGVLVPHRGIVRLVSKPDYVHLSNHTRTLQLAPLSFDASTFEIWAPLLNGGTCVIYPERVPDLVELRRVIGKESINTLWLTASLFNFLMDAAPQTLRGIKQLLVGGEALSPKHIKRAQKVLQETILINGYGPTENTTFSCCYRIPRNQRIGKSIPIGLPLNHSYAYVLDKDHKLQPPGVPGELFVGGLGLSLGYLNKPDLTCKRFVDNPYNSKGARSLYRTGDRVFQHVDGKIDYLERFDDQVKIRGYRIEPSEIQCRILQLPMVKEAAVLVSNNTRQEKELAAVIVLKPRKHLTEPRLKEYLLESLPEYMIPSRTIFIPSLPLTSNGKIDRSALLQKLEANGHQSSQVASDFALAHKEVLVTAWKDVLGKVPTSIDESFYEAGGHSLLATQFLFRLHTLTGIRLPFSSFQSRTSIRSLSQWMERHQADNTNGSHKGRSTGFPLEPIKIEEKSELSLKWDAYLKPEIADPDNVRSLIICRAVLLDGDLKPSIFEKAIDFVINLHERFRTHAEVVNGKLFERIEPRVNVGVTKIDVSHLDPRKALQKARSIFESESVTRKDSDINIRDPYLFRLKLIKVEPEKHLFIIAVHHGIADGASLEIFYSQVSTAYNSLIRGESPLLQPTSISFRQYEKCLENWLDQGNRERLTQFWEDQLKDIQRIKYPFLVKKIPETAGQNEFEHFEFTPEWTKRIRQFTKTHSITNFTFFTTLIKWMVARYTDEMDSYASSAINSRIGITEEDIVGDFGSTILLRNYLNEHRTFLEQEMVERKTLYECMDHNHIAANSIESQQKECLPFTKTFFGQLQIIKGPDTGESLNLKGIDSKFLPRTNMGAITRLGFVIREPKDRLQITFMHAPRLFVANSYERLKYNFQQFLRIIIKQPHIRLHELPDLTRAKAYRSPLTESEKKTSMFLPPDSHHASLNTPAKISTVKGDESDDLSARRASIRRTLTKLWTDVLEKEPSSLEEDFFSAGGHSLLAAHFVFKIQSRFAVRLPMPVFQKKASIRKLSAWIENECNPDDPFIAKDTPFLVKQLPVNSLNGLSMRWRTAYRDGVENPETTQPFLIARAIELEGTLRPRLLIKALEYVINLHERLRTYAVKIDGEYFEKILPQVRLKIPRKDLSHLSEYTAMKVAKAIYQEMCTCNIDMRTPPLLRISLSRLSKRKHFLCMGINHAAADGHTLGVIYQQVSQVYNDLVTKKQISVHPPKLSFRQYEQSMEAWLEKGNRKRIQTYWKRLSRNLRPIPYPFLKKRLPKKVKWNVFDHNEFDPIWTRRIQAIAEENSVSTYQFFATVVKWLIARYTQNEDSYVTTAINIRSGPEENAIVGELSTVLLIRNNLKSSTTFLEQLKYDQTTFYKSMEHKYVSATSVPIDLGQNGGSIHKVAGQCKVSYVPDLEGNIDFVNLKATTWLRNKLTAATRLGFIIREPQDRLIISFQYAPDIFVVHGIERMKHNFQWFIRLVLENPGITLALLPDLSTPSAYKRPVNQKEQRQAIIKAIK